MPRTNWQNHGSTEILSTHIAGAYEAIGKMEDIFNFGTQVRTGVTLTCVDTAWRIYESPADRRNWTSAPVTVRRNGNVVATGFRVDFGGGAIIFDTPLVGTDVITADFTHVDNVNLGTFPPAVHNHDAGTITTGTLVVGRGGTGATSLTGVVIGNGINPLSAVAAPTGAIVGTTDTQTLSNKTFTAPRITSASNIADVNGNELIVFPATVANAVNEITVSNAATGVNPSIAVSGADTNISLNLIPKGTGTVQVNGVVVPTVSSTDTLTNKSLTSPTFTGTPTAPTATQDTNTTQIATTAFVVAQASATTPIVNGTATVGTSLRYSRADHVHGTDTGRAAATHNHAATEITSGTLAVDRGGTGATTHTVGSVLIGNATAAVTSLSRNGIDSRASFPPDSHSHGSITNVGAIGSTANLPVITGVSGVLAAGSFGTLASTFCQGNDARLSDARTPVAHNQDASTITTGTLAVARGGTGIASYTASNYIRALNSTTLEQRTPAQVSADIGALTMADINAIRTRLRMGAM